MRLSPNRDSTGKLLLEAGRSLEAKEQLQTAVALNPDHLPSIELLLDSLLATRDESSAVTLLGSLHRRHVSHPAQWHLDVGAALVERGKHQEARRQYAAVASDDPTPTERREAELALSRMATR